VEEIRHAANFSDYEHLGAVVERLL
jgi:hypothetical protein